MKKMMALLLVSAMAFGMLAGCKGDGNSETTPSTVGQPVVDTTEGTTAVTGPRIVDAGKVSKDGRGWVQMDNGTIGVYFDLWTNDVPVDSTWATRYVPDSDDGITFVRDGEPYQIDATVLKFSNVEWFLCLDRWLWETAGLEDMLPLQAGDMIVLEGDFVSEDSDWGIHFDPTYITLKAANIVTFSTEEPE